MYGTDMAEGDSTAPSAACILRSVCSLHPGAGTSCLLSSSSFQWSKKAALCLPGWSSREGQLSLKLNSSSDVQLLSLLLSHKCLLYGSKQDWRRAIQAQFSLLGTAIGCLCYSGQTVTLCPQFCMLWPWQRRRFVSQRTEEPVNAGVKDRPREYCILVSLHSIPENFEEVRGATRNPGKINKQFV